MVGAPGVEFDGVCFSIGEFSLADVSLAVADGEYFVMTGPNGAGKTLLLRLVSGLHRPDSGDIRIGGRSVLDLAPWERNVGYVPQDGVLFPNLTVRGNIAFGLEAREGGLLFSLPSAVAGAAFRLGARRGSRAKINSEVERVAALLAIEPLLDRMPAGLSGGESQKASLARALVLRPSVLLLDEPVSSIDEDARDGICRELKRVQREVAITTIHVSHNRHETELVADRVAALRRTGSSSTVRDDAQG